MQNSFTKNILPLIIMLLDLAIAFILDRWGAVLRQQSMMAFSPFLVLWSYTISALLLAAVLLASFTWIVFRARPASWVTGIFIVIGLFFSAIPVLYYTWPVAFLVVPITALISLPQNLLIAGAFVAMTGIAVLVLPRRTE